MKRILMMAAAVLVATFAFAKIEVPKEVKIGEAAKKQPAVTFNHGEHAAKLVQRPLVKVCGLTRQDDVDVAVDAGADHLVVHVAVDVAGHGDHRDAGRDPSAA